MLDNIFIDKSSNFIIKPHINGLSDHESQLITLNDETIPAQNSKTIITRSFLNYLSYENWRDVFMENDTNSMYNNFLNTFLRGFNYSFPTFRKHKTLTSKINGLLKEYWCLVEEKSTLYIE